MLHINEQFYSLQGEGASIGRPANFVRFQGCPGRCKWCDTKYTWKFKEPTCTVEEALGKLHKRAQITVLTGGEPLVWDKTESFYNFVEDCSKVTEIEIETAGFYVPSTRLDERVSRYNISPKLGNSGFEFSGYTETIPLLSKKFGSKSYWKFVVSTSENVLEALDFVTKYNIDKERVYLMPEGNTVSGQVSLMKKLSVFCKDLGISLTPRLHVLLWDGARGT